MTRWGYSKEVNRFAAARAGRSAIARDRDAAFVGNAATWQGYLPPRRSVNESSGALGALGTL